MLVGAALVLNALLFLAAPTPFLWLHPVAPPLTHLPELGEPVLGTLEAPPTGGPGAPPRGPPPLRGLAGAVEVVVNTTGTEEQRAALRALRTLDQGVMPHARRAMEARVAVEDDAVALAEALGPERVGAILARREELSTRYGEGRAWAAAIERVNHGR